MGSSQNSSDEAFCSAGTSASGVTASGKGDLVQGVPVQIRTVKFGLSKRRRRRLNLDRSYGSFGNGQGWIEATRVEMERRTDKGNLTRRGLRLLRFDRPD
jgi:hypothetical protein